MTDDTHLRDMLTLLVPGDDGNWPAAGAVIHPPMLALFGDPSTLAFLGRLAEAVHRAGTEAEARIRILADTQARDTVEFTALLRAVYAAYYASEPVQDAVRRLADSGPREPSPYFDPALVARSAATQPKETAT